MKVILLFFEKVNINWNPFLFIVQALQERRRRCQTNGDVGYDGDGNDDATPSDAQCSTDDVDDVKKKH